MGRKPLINKEKEKEILNSLIYKMIDKHALMEELNISMKTAERFIKKNNLFQTSTSNINCIKDYLNGERPAVLYKKYNMSQANFNSLLRFRKIPARGTTYFANFNYFDIIDSPNKAYFLGFITADGCVYRNTLRISISLQDIDLLEKFKKEINSNHLIKQFETFSSFDAKNNSICNMCYIEITSKHMIQKLEEHNITPNKTHKINQIPKKIPNKYVKDFIRGYIDGDGSFGSYTHNDGYLRNSLNLVGTENFLIDIKKWLENNTNCKFNNYLYDRHPERKNNIRAMTATGKENVANILSFLYKDSSMHLDRKYNNFINIISNNNGAKKSNQTELY